MFPTTLADSLTCFKTRSKKADKRDPVVSSLYDEFFAIPLAVIRRDKGTRGRKQRSSLLCCSVLETPQGGTVLGLRARWCGYIYVLQFFFFEGDECVFSLDMYFIMCSRRSSSSRFRRQGPRVLFAHNISGYVKNASSISSTPARTVRCDHEPTL